MTTARFAHRVAGDWRLVIIIHDLSFDERSELSSFVWYICHFDTRYGGLFHLV